MEIRKIHEKHIPESLKELPQPPKELFIIGDLPEEELTYLCVVGSRKYTSYGKESCEKILEGLRDYPIAIVSGFAMGIDTIAHKKALEIGLKTIVFPGSGLSKKAMYPKANIKMMEEVLNSGGCFVSEFAPDFHATLWSFPMRNRLMAGISKAVLVIEAEEKSGTLITARLATEYNKDVLAVPGSIFSQNSKGTNRLIRQGATPVTTSDDVLEALGFERKDQISRDESRQKSLFQDLSPEEKEIIEILKYSPTERDELARKLGKPAHKVNALISILEIKDLVREELGVIRIAS